MKFKRCVKKTLGLTITALSAVIMGYVLNQ